MLKAQSLTPHDPAIENASLFLENDSEKGIASFEFIQYLSDYELGPKQIPIQMMFCFSNIQPEDGIQSIEGEYAANFEWEYNEVLNCMKATQKKSLMANQRGLINIAVQSIDKIPCSEGNKMGFNINLQPAPCMNGVNNIENDNVHAYTCVSPISSTEQIAQKLECVIFPNPIEHFFSFELNAFTEQLEIELIDAQGKILDTFLFKNTKQERINVRNYAAGIYTLRMTTKDGKSTNKKISIIK